ncbi:AAA family ATPase [Alteromonas sp. KUL49]|uniref:AAA family ATPase n=1 Tax=Alteromonas sp. KUL49 TaxID=2480798 RepID=UPI0010FFB60A|nr:AAA family ATPase [Alteromonas sp. KUL49]GEA13097.1 hypothetical protein KUL49_34720 [Alteromonas sp. KUL49]
MNKSKTVFSSKAHNRHVTGVTITNDGKISLGRKNKRYLKHKIHQFSLGQLNSHETMHLQGLLAHARHIESRFYESLIKKYSQEVMLKILRLQMNREIQLKSEIAFLDGKFKAGSISSGFKLYDIYENGVFDKNSDGEMVCTIDKNHKIASEYLIGCRNLLNKKNTRIHISRLTLSDFRRFKTLKVKLDKHLTVIIGDNGAGKTTIVDGITKSLSWLSANILKKGGIGLRVTDYDVNIDSVSFAEVTLRASVNESSHYSISLFKTAKGAKEAKKK